MTQTLDLRSDAEAEAETLRAIRSTSAGCHAAPITDQVFVTAIRRLKQGPLDHPGAIFFVHVTIVDAAGRALEDLLVPVHVKFRALIHRRRRRDVRRDGEDIHDRHQTAVVAAVREHVSTRLTNISNQYDCGLARSIRREEQLSRLLAGERPSLVQAGLFDRRAIKEYESARSDDTAASDDSDARRYALQSAVLGMTMRGPDIVLLLLVKATA